MGYISSNRESIVEDAKPATKRTYKIHDRLVLKEGTEYPYKDPIFRRMVKEYFDISDQNTRAIMVSVDEEDQSQILASLTGKLYDLIVDKADEIDFGEIPRTRGDIEELSNYDKLTECVATIHELIKQYKQDDECIVTIETAIENVKVRKNLFRKGFMADTEFVMLTYNTIVLAIISATSLMISSCIDFIKDPKENTFKLSIDKVGLSKSKEMLLFDNLKDFNKGCANGNIDKALGGVVANKQKNLVGTSITTLGAIAIGGVILFNILPLLRELTYFFYYSRTRVSDYFNLQADLLQMSAENIKDNNVETVDDKKRVIKRQLSIADRFRKIADFFAVNSKKAEVKTDNAIKAEKRKLKADDVLDDVPDSTASALF